MADTLSQALLEASLLSSLPEEDEGSVIIDVDRRTMVLPTGFFFGVYNDKDILKVPFVIPRYYNELDLSEFQVTVNYINSAGYGNIYRVTDAEVTDSAIRFKWVTGRGVFVKEGTVRFIICLRQIGSNGEVEKEFNTTIASANVLKGLEVDENPDPIAYSILAHMEELKDQAEAAVEVVEGAADRIDDAVTEAEQAIAAMYHSPYIAPTAADMLSHDKVYVYTGNETGYTFGNWYYWNGSAFVSGGVYNATAIETDTTLSHRGEAADAKKTGDEISGLREDLEQEIDDIKEDLYGSETTEIVTEPVSFTSQAGTISSVDGSINSSSSSAYTIIDVAGAISVTFRHNTYSSNYGYAFMDASNNYISGARTQLNGESTIDVPATAKTFRVCWNTSATTQAISVTKEVTVVTGGEFQKKLTAGENIVIDDDVISAIIPTLPEGLDESIKVSEIVEDRIVYSTNILTKEDVTEGKNYDASGNIIDSSYDLSTWIPIEPNMKYMCAASSAYMSWFTEDKIFISRVSADKRFCPITSPSNAAYCRYATNSSVWQINKGETLLAYEDYYDPYLDVSDDVKTIDYRPTFSEDVSAPSFYAASNNFGNVSNKTASEVYALYDALVTNYSNYVSCEELGNDAWGNRIAYYKFRQTKVTGQYTCIYPKILIVCGLHGYEHVSAFNVYNMMEYLCNHHTVLRDEVDFDVLPVANPSGWDVYSRKNAAGIDLNRSFPSGFVAGDDPTAGDYGGTEPLTQLEAQYINGLLANNGYDAVIDHHNYSVSDTPADEVWITSVTHEGQKIGGNLVNRLWRRYSQEYEWFPNTLRKYGYTSIGSLEGSLKAQAAALGVKYSFTFEVGGSWGTLYPDGTQLDAIHTKTCLNALANFIGILLKEYETDTIHMMA